MEMIGCVSSFQRAWVTNLALGVLGACVVGCEREVIVASTRHETEWVRSNSGARGNPRRDAGAASVSDVASVGTPTPVLEPDGQLDASGVAAVLRAAIGPVRSCYEQSLRTRRNLSGRFEIHFTIHLDGTVALNGWTGTAFEGTSVGPCVGRVVLGLTFPRPTGGSVEFSFPFNFSPAD